MADYADEGEEKREAVDQSQEGLDYNDGVDEPREELAGEYSVLLYQLGEVVQSTCYERWLSFGLRRLVERGKREKRRVRMRSSMSEPLYIPIARVRNPKPSNTPV